VSNFTQLFSSSPAIIVIVALSSLVFPIRFIVDVTHDISSSIASIGFAIAALASVGILFGQKMLRILNISQATRKIHTTVSEDKATRSAIYAVDDSPIDDYAKLSTDEERFDYCRKQILEWQGRMFALNSDQSINELSKSGQMVGVHLQLSATEISRSECIVSSEDTRGGGRQNSFVATAGPTDLEGSNAIASTY
jgi:hypothetical protein